MRLRGLRPCSLGSKVPQALQRASRAHVLALVVGPIAVWTASCSVEVGIVGACEAGAPRHVAFEGAQKGGVKICLGDEGGRGLVGVKMCSSLRVSVR